MNNIKIKPTAFLNYGTGAIRNIELRLWGFDERQHKQFRAVPVAFEEIEQGHDAPPFVSLSSDELQGFVDQLWEAGVRPTQSNGSIGQLGAIASHLTDMRAIAFGKLKIEHPARQPK